KFNSAERDKELDAVRALIKEEIAAGFYNIDIDTSTLVDLSKATLEEQQAINVELAADFTAFIRRHEPQGVTISVGGEIGEVGGKNSDVHELRAFMNGYIAALRTRGPSLTGISKISVQTGTAHGGFVNADGTVRTDVKIDLKTLEELSRIAREEYGLAGAVQHGASTLPPEAFDAFPRVGACEIHLPTDFQNMIYEHAQFPADPKAEMDGGLRAHAVEERKPKDPRISCRAFEPVRSDGLPRRSASARRRACAVHSSTRHDARSGGLHGLQTLPTCHSCMRLYGRAGGRRVRQLEQSGALGVFA